MLPSCNPVVGLTFFTSAAACAAWGLSAVAQGNVTFGDRPRKTATGSLVTRVLRRSVTSAMRYLKGPKILCWCLNACWQRFFLGCSERPTQELIPDSLSTFLPASTSLPTKTEPSDKAEEPAASSGALLSCALTQTEKELHGAELLLLLAKLIHLHGTLSPWQFHNKSGETPAEAGRRADTRLRRCPRLSVSDTLNHFRFSSLVSSWMNWKVILHVTWPICLWRRGAGSNCSFRLEISHLCEIYHWVDVSSPS